MVNIDGNLIMADDDRLPEEYRDRIEMKKVRFRTLPGVDMSSGSLGQGISAAVGMALSAKLSNESYRVYTLLGDGEIQEGQVWEAAMFAGHRKLDNLVVIVDNNGLQIDGKIDDVCSPYPIDKKFEAFNFHVINVADGNDMDQLKAAFDEAKATKGMPKIGRASCRERV